MPSTSILPSVNPGRETLDWAEKVVHTSVVEGDGAGYDIQSYYPDGRVKFIEVKTTAGGPQTPFLITTNELAFAKRHADHYVLVRVYDYRKQGPTGKYFIIEGDLESKLLLQATEFRARIKNE